MTSPQSIGWNGIDIYFIVEEHGTFAELLVTSDGW